MSSKVTWVSGNDPTPPHKNNHIKPSATITLQRIVKGQVNNPELDRREAEQGLHRNRVLPTSLLRICRASTSVFNTNEKPRSILGCWSQSFTANDDQTCLGRSERSGFAHFRSKVSKTRSKLVGLRSRWSQRQVVLADLLSDFVQASNLPEPQLLSSANQNWILCLLHRL